MPSILTMPRSTLVARYQELHGRNEKTIGATLVEALLFLAISAVVIIGGVVLYQQAMGDTRLDQAENQVNTIISQTQKLYSTTNNYTGLTTANGVAARIFPADMVDTSGNVRDPWKGTVTLATSASACGAQCADLTLNTVPQDSCAALASTNITSSGAGLYTISINGTAKSPPIDPATAVGACNVNTAAGNVLIYTFQ